MLTEYFKSNKASSSASNIRPDTSDRESKLGNVRNLIEKQKQVLRGDDVRILWIPKQHSELDPSKFVAIFLLNEISLRLEQMEESDVLKGTEETFDLLPSELWSLATRYTKDCEEYYLKNGLKQETVDKKEDA